MAYAPHRAVRNTTSGPAVVEMAEILGARLNRARAGLEDETWDRDLIRSAKYLSDSKTRYLLEHLDIDQLKVLHRSVRHTCESANQEIDRLQDLQRALGELDVVIAASRPTAKIG